MSRDTGGHDFDELEKVGTVRSGPCLESFGQCWELVIGTDVQRRRGKVRCADPRPYVSYNTGHRIEETKNRYSVYTNSELLYSLHALQVPTVTKPT
jgi:hypothetical protein